MEYLKSNLESASKIYELLTREGLSLVVLETLASIVQSLPKFYDYIVKAAKRTARMNSFAPYAELLELFKKDDLDLKVRVVIFINSMLAHAPNDKMICRFVAQLEALNFYEYLQEASTKKCVELNQVITKFQGLASVVIKATQYENEALRNRVKELTMHCEKLEEKSTLYAQQQNLYTYLKEEFRSFSQLAKVSIERGTLYTPCNIHSFSIIVMLTLISHSIEPLQSRDAENLAANCIPIFYIIQNLEKRCREP